MNPARFFVCYRCVLAACDCVKRLVFICHFFEYLLYRHEGFVDVC